MFQTIKTLFDGANARAEERVRETYSIELIDQKNREATRGLKAAKTTLAGFKQRQRAEDRHIAELEIRISDLTGQARAALEAGREDLAEEAAGVIAGLENERTMRRQTRDRLEARVIRLQGSVEAVNRRIQDLKQGAIAARAARSEHRMQRKLNTTLHGPDALSEAEELIRDVLCADDPFEQAQILQDIDAGLSGQGVADRLAEEGFGKSKKTTGADVLSRLKSDK